MKRYSILPHTADLRMHVQGDSLEQLFSNAVFGLADVMKPEEATYPDSYPLSRKIVLNSIDPTSLLIEFLSEVLFLSNKDKALYPGLKINEMHDVDADATITGFPVEGFGEDVKAVTYHEAEIICSDGKFECTIILDI